jgi:hypothetical protein
LGPILARSYLLDLCAMLQRARHDMGNTESAFGASASGPAYPPRSPCVTASYHASDDRIRPDRTGAPSDRATRPSASCWRQDLACGGRIAADIDHHGIHLRSSSRCSARRATVVRCTYSEPRKHSAVAISAGRDVPVTTYHRTREQLSGTQSATQR